MNDLDWQSYVHDEKDEGHEVLKNKFGIKKFDELQRKEAEVTFSKLIELYENPIDGDFDKTHLCLIHEYLFKDLYDWAGKFRIVDIEKGHSHFTKHNRIIEHLDIELAKYNQKINTIFSSYSLACFLADMYIVLLDIHPFREGNGRTVREFVREFTLAKTANLPMGQYELAWSKMDKNLIDDHIQFASSYRSVIELEFYKALVPVVKTNSIKRG